MRALERARMPYFLVHTNQHYSEDMDAVFFRELGIRLPDFNLHVRAEKPGRMVGQMVEKLELIFERERPVVVLAEGDTNSVLAAALASAKCGIPFGHVEAGLRSFDRTMPEEINRVIVDHVSDFLFAPTAVSKRNLQKEGIRKGVHVVGNTIVDAVEEAAALGRENPRVMRHLGLTPKSFGVLTLHRQSNADSPGHIRSVLQGVRMAGERIQLSTIIFPMHPRTRKTVAASGIVMPRLVHVIEPVSFIQMISLVSHARIVFTDSGGLQEEACILRTPCVTLRDNTERPETLIGGGNVLAGTKSVAIAHAAEKMLRGKVHWHNPFGNGTSGARIVSILKKEL